MTLSVAARWRFAAAMIAGAAGQAGAQLQPTDPATRPTTRILNCTTSGCHSNESERKFLHGPNAVQACDACHDYKDEKSHTFELKRKGKDLCAFCHIDKAGTEGPVVHKPVADGNCTGCHDPHGATNRHMLKKDTSAQLCTTCHKETIHGATVHKPASEDCASCHKPHTAEHPKLLVKTGRELCLGCHADVAHTVANAKFPHDPLNGDCLQCHSPHASDHIKVLKSSPADLCASCHKQVLEKAKGSSHPHGAVTDQRACLNCHTPHGSSRGKQLADDPVASCLNCHSKPITVKDRTIAAVREVEKGAGGLHQHGPISKDDCAGCHDVHGGQRGGLLTGAYTSAFYQAYSEDAYQLCFKCHDKGLITGEAQGKQTGFRDGLVNLHAVHVKSGKNAHSCRACHTVHASRNAQQICDSVQFGQWKLPINFKAAENGGSCAPGCHRPATYDRSRSGGAPTGKPPALGGDQPAPATAPGESTTKN